MDYPSLMQLAIDQARLAAGEGEVPVGAILVDASGNLLASGHNRREQLSDPMSHAETEVIRQAAAARGDWRLDDCTLVVTLEPCVMCAGAILAARIPRVVFGAWDERVGAVGSRYDLLRDPRLGTPVEVISGVAEDACASLLRSFFDAQRSSNL